MKGCLDAITMKPSVSFEKTKLNAEISDIRNVGITFETRPDYLKPSHIDNILLLGGTRVEIGVQNIYFSV